MKKLIFSFLLIFALVHIVNAQADLVILASPSVSPSTVHKGITFTVTFSVKNIGNIAAPRSSTGIYITDSPTLDNPILLKKISLESLGVDSCSNNIEFKTPVPYFIGGNGSGYGVYYIIIKLNDDLSITESNTANNSLSMPLTIYYDAWAAQNIPYPIIFIHGLKANNSTWDPLITDLKNMYGWSYGGNMNFCLNQDGNLHTASPNDYKDYTDINTLQPDDFYTVNFDVDTFGNAYSIDVESNQSAIVKQGLAIRDAVAHVRQVTGRDKVILVGHSMGGLASREYLQNPYIQPPINHHNIAKLCTIGTPNGGSNAGFAGLGPIFGLADEMSEAVRDLKHSYLTGYAGTYLFGGDENSQQIDGIPPFFNIDVNCNGSLGDHITGLNEKNLPTNVSYSCIIGTGSLLGGDGVVDEESANLSIHPGNITAETFTLGQPGIIPITEGVWHSFLPQQTSAVIQGLDEPNDYNSYHAYEVSSGQLYYGIISLQSISSPPKDLDNYEINVLANGTLNIQVYNIVLAQFYVNVFNSSATSVYSATSNGKSYINVNTPNLSAGNYYVVLSSYPSTTSWEYPYAFKFTYAPAVVTYCSGTTNLTATTGTFADGSGSNNYDDNADCRWKIQPSGATSITLSFSEFDVSNTGDTVYVYNGGTTASPILLKWTGNTLPTNVTSTGGTMLVRFSTNANTTAAGWTANYTSVVVPTYCNGTTTLTSASGSFSDCSGASDYGNNSNCSWLINPIGAYSITLTFNHFNTEAANDIVNVYDGNDNSAALLGSFSGNSIPQVLISTGGALFIEFLTNDTITAPGWDASYTSDVPFATDGIVKYEYWYDDNYATKITTPIMLTKKFTLNSSLPTNSLSVGLHRLNVRFVDNSGHWSSVISQFFYKKSIMPYADKKLTKYEYWFDTDYLSKVDASIGSLDRYNLLTGINTSTLSQGLHIFNVRFKDNAGQWSSVISQFFYKNTITNGVSNKIKAYRYWFDMAISDMTTVTLPTPVNPLDLITEINTCNLALGTHNLNIQFLDVLGYWSSVLTNSFAKNTQPTASITLSGSSSICMGDTVEITASSGSSYLWSNGATTQSIHATTADSYWVSVTDVWGCTAVSNSSTITVNPIPIAPTSTPFYEYCQNTTATELTATGSGLLWYTMPTNGAGNATAPTPSTSTIGTTHFYVSQTVSNCESPRTEIAVTVNAIPTLPSATTSYTYCQNEAAAQLTATGSGLFWYTVPTNGTGNATAPTPSTNTVGTTHYYVSQTVSNCESPRTDIAVTVNTIPSLPSATTSYTYCQNEVAAQLTAIGSGLLWYTVPTNGTGNATAPTPLTNIVGTTHYYVSQAVSNCESPRTEIAVTVNAIPSLPSATTSYTYCQNETAAQLTATGSSLLWYTMPTNGVGNALAPTPLTSTVGTTHFYVSQTVSNCESPRTEIAVTVNAIPTLPSATTSYSYCQNESVAQLTATGSGLLWYTVPTNGIGNATAPTPSTSTVGTTHFYVSQTVSNCESPRSDIAVTITPTPPAPSATQTIHYCINDVSSPLSASGSGLLWYTQPTNGVGSPTAPTPATGVTGTTSYYVSQTIDNCEGPRIQITITVYPIPPTPTITQSGGDLQSDAGIGNQWYYETVILNGFTLPIYTPIAEGNYYVIVTLDGCSSLPSNIFNFIFTGVENQTENAGVLLFPNPTTGEVTFRFPKKAQFSHLIVYNNIGQLLFEKQLDSGLGTTIDLAKYATGVYFIRLIGEKPLLVKVIKE